MTAWRQFFSFFDALYLRSGCPKDKSEHRKRGKGGGMCNYLQAIDWAGSRRRPAISRNGVCVGHISPKDCGRLGPAGTDWGTFSRSLTLCISGTAALRTNQSSAKGGRGGGWATFCKLSIELAPVVVGPFLKFASVGNKLRQKIAGAWGPRVPTSLCI